MERSFSVLSYFNAERRKETEFTVVIKDEGADLKERLIHESHTSTCARIHEKERSENGQLAEINGKFWAELG